MKLFLFAFLTILLLIPILYIIPLGFNSKGKLLIIVVSFVLALLGLVANNYFNYELWQTLIMLFGFALIVTYFTEKKLRTMLIYSDHSGESERLGINDTYLLVDRDLDDHTGRDAGRDAGRDGIETFEYENLNEAVQVENSVDSDEISDNENEILDDDLEAQPAEELQNGMQEDNGDVSQDEIPTEQDGVERNMDIVSNETNIEVEQQLLEDHPVNVISSEDLDSIKTVEKTDEETDEEQALLDANDKEEDLEFEYVDHNDNTTIDLEEMNTNGAIEETFEKDFPENVEEDEDIEDGTCNSDEEEVRNIGDAELDTEALIEDAVDAENVDAGNVEETEYDSLEQQDENNVDDEAMANTFEDEEIDVIVEEVTDAEIVTEINLESADIEINDHDESSDVVYIDENVESILEEVNDPSEMVDESIEAETDSETQGEITPDDHDIDSTEVVENQGSTEAEGQVLEELLEKDYDDAHEEDLIQDVDDESIRKFEETDEQTLVETDGLELDVEEPLEGKYDEATDEDLDQDEEQEHDIVINETNEPEHVLEGGNEQELDQNLVFMEEDHEEAEPLLDAELANEEEQDSTKLEDQVLEELVEVENDDVLEEFVQQEEHNEEADQENCAEQDSVQDIQQQKDVDLEQEEDLLEAVLPNQEFEIEVEETDQEQIIEQSEDQGEEQDYEQIENQDQEQDSEQSEDQIQELDLQQSVEEDQHHDLDLEQSVEEDQRHDLDLEQSVEQDQEQAQGQELNIEQHEQENGTDQGSEQQPHLESQQHIEVDEQTTQLKEQRKSKIQQQMFHTMVSEIHLSRSMTAPDEYEHLIKEYLHPELPDQDYYTFAQLLVEHYIYEEKYESLSKLLTDLIDRFDQYPILMEEILYLFDKYCQDIK